MFLHWQTHQEYLSFLHEAKIHFDSSLRLRLRTELAASREKLRLLDLDHVMEFMAPLYSSTGRAAKNQPQIFRSLVLMLDLNITSVSAWVDKLKADHLLAYLIGCSPDSLPPLGSYFDFMDRLWLLKKNFQKLGRKDLFPKGKNRKPKKPAKGKKLPNRHSGITRVMADAALSGRDLPFHYEALLQEIFRIAAVEPSRRAGLIPSDGITISGDGTCVHTHSNPYGHRVCSCARSGIPSCSCDRHYSVPDAHWGWDSDLERYFFGYTLYMLSFYNESCKVDLPLHIRFLDARRNDSVSIFVALSEFRSLNPHIRIRNLCLDSIHDNYPTYQLCARWDIQPFIDLNDNRGRPKSIPDTITIDADGTPLCQAGLRMVYNGFCSGRSRCKWRCPAACKKVKGCPLDEPCFSSPYGRCVYTKPAWDVRLYTPVPRGTEEYRRIYNCRTSSERVNNRILNDYHLHDMRIHRRKRYSFFAMIAGIHIHLDARLKKAGLEAAVA